MCDTENGSVEVRELLELVLQEPILVQSDSNDELSTNEQDDLEKDKPNVSMDVEPEIPINVNVELQQKDSPIIAAESTHSHIIPAPEPDLRLIESNALKLIAQYGSDSDSDTDESDNDTESSDEVVAESSDDVVAIDDVEVVLQKTITKGNYRVVSSDSEDRYGSNDTKCNSARFVQ